MRLGHGVGLATAAVILGNEWLCQSISESKAAQLNLRRGVVLQLERLLPLWRGLRSNRVASVEILLRIKPR